MRTMSILVCLFVGGCSVVFGTGDLRELDGGSGVTDMGLRDGGMADIRAIDDAETILDQQLVDQGDGPCVNNSLEGPILSVVEAGFYSQLEVQFTNTSRCGHSIEVVAPDFSVEVDIAPGTNGVRFVYTKRVALFHEDVPFVIDGQPLPFDVPVSVEILDDEGEPYEFTASPMIDVADDGAVVFAAGGTSHAVDRGDIFHWAFDDTSASAPIGISDHELAAPRIAGVGDETVILFQDRNSDAMLFFRLSNPGVLSRLTAAGATWIEAEVQNVGSDYFFALYGTTMAGADGSYVYAGALAALLPSETRLRVHLTGTFGPPRLVASGPSAPAEFLLGYTLGTVDPRPTYYRSDTVQVFPNGDCVVANNSRVDIRAAGRPPALAFIGRCNPEVSDTLVAGALRVPLPPELPSDLHLVEAATDLQTFLLRSADSEVGGFWITRPMDAPEFQELALTTESMPADAFPDLRMDAAALSNNGDWAAYAIVTRSATFPATPHTMQLARVKVHD